MFRRQDIHRVNIYNKAKEHFQNIGVDVNKEELHNAVMNVYDFLQDRDILITIVLKALYPRSEFISQEELNESRKGEN